MNSETQNIEQLADVFSLLGEPTRLRIVLACFDGPKAVGEIAQNLNLSLSLISHHLRLLRAARIVHAEREGKHVYCSLTDAHIRTMLGNMLEHIEEDDHS